MATAASVQLPFDLIHFIKECQLQHGLRTADYARYHAYLSNRLATVRKQLGFQSQAGAGRKGIVAKYARREVTPELLLATVPSANANSNSGSEQQQIISVDSATAAQQAIAFRLDALAGDKAASHGCGGGRYLELLALLSERCLAAYEGAVQRRGKDGNTAGEDGLVGGFGASGKKGSRTAAANDSGLVDARKRLNKAVKWAEELFAIASGVYPSASSSSSASSTFTDYASAAAACVVLSCEGYLHETIGRCAAGHSGRSPTAHFAKARECFANAAKAINAMLAFADKDPSVVGTITTTATDGANATTTESSATIVSAEQSFGLLIAKAAELEDRILFAQQREQQQQEGSAAAAPAYTPAPMPALYVPTAAGAAATAAGASGKKALKKGGAASSSSAAADNSDEGLVITTCFLTPRSTVAWVVPAGAGAAGGEIPVYNIKVKEFLREAAAVGAPEAMRAVVGAATVSGASSASTAEGFFQLSPSAITVGHIINVGQQLRIVDLYDRAIGFLNDALTHARSELRAVQGDAARRQAQRLTLCLQFYISRFTADRTFFVIECLARRFWFHANLRTVGGCGVAAQAAAAAAASEAKAKANTSNAATAAGGATAEDEKKKRKAAASAQKYAQKRAAGKASKIPTASPLEILRLYITAGDQLLDCYQTPGVEGSDAPAARRLETEINVCRLGRLLYAGAAWAVTGNHPAALQCLTIAKRHALFATAEDASAAKKAGGNGGKDAVEVVEASVKSLPAALSLSFVADRITLSVLLSVAEMNLAEHRSVSSSVAARASSAADAAKEEGEEDEALKATRYLIDNLASDESFAITAAAKKKTTAATTAAAAAEDSANAKKEGTSAASPSIVTANLVPLPPKAMPVPAKPAFVDIAATFVDFGTNFSPSSAARVTAVPKKAAAPAAQSRAAPQQQQAKTATEQQKSGGGWLGGWGWGKKQ